MSSRLKFRAVIQDAGGGGAYIEEARRAQTRQSRVARTVEMLLHEKSCAMG